MKETRETNLFDLLLIFFRWIAQCFSRLFSAMGWCLQISFKYLPLTLILCIAGLGAGIYFSQPERRIYKVEGMAVLNGPTANVVKEISKPLEWAFPHQVPGGQNFVQKCSISEDVAKSIKRMETFYVIDNLNDSTPDHVDFKNKHDLTDTLNVRMRNYLYFRFRTKRIDKVEEIEQGLMHYFNTHPTMVAWNELHRQNLHDVVNMYTQQILYLDSLSKRAYLEDPVHAKLTLHQNTLIIGEQKKQFFHEEISYLQHLLEGQELALTCDSLPLYFPGHLSIMPRPINGRIKTLVLALMGAYALSLLIAAGWKYRKSIFDYLRRA